MKNFHGLQFSYVHGGDGSFINLKRGIKVFCSSLPEISHEIVWDESDDFSEEYL